MAAADVAFVGYDNVEIETQVTAVRHLPDGRIAVLLRESPFYAESGGQLADQGEIIGERLQAVTFRAPLEVGRPAAPPHLTSGAFRPTGRDPQRYRDARRRRLQFHW